MFVRADNKRIARKGAMGGWDIVRARLVGEEHPMIFFFSNCVDIIRTLPAMQHDQNNPEDLNTSMEDHAVDSVRYGCMSRPYVAGKPHTEKKLLHKSTFNDIMRQNRNIRGTNRGYV